MSDLNKDVVNNTENRLRDNLPKVHGRDRTFERKFLPVTKGVNPLKIEFFNVVAHLEANLVQFGNTLGQRSQAIGHRWF
jgi:hypothetical protein